MSAHRFHCGNLPYAATAVHLRRAIEALGLRVTEAFVVYDAEKRSRGFGFVTIESERTADSVIGDLDGVLVEGRPMHPHPTMPRPPSRRAERSLRAQPHGWSAEIAEAKHGTWLPPDDGEPARGRGAHRTRDEEEGDER